MPVHSFNGGVVSMRPGRPQSERGVLSGNERAVTESKNI